MSIITLQQLKDQLNVTFNAQDAKLMDIINRTERELFQFIGVTSLEELYAAMGETGSAMASAALESAVILGCSARWNDPGADIWRGGTLARLLFPYRVPALSGGTTA